MKIKRSEIRKMYVEELKIKAFRKEDLANKGEKS